MAISILRWLNGQLRRETTLTVARIAARLQMGSRAYVVQLLHSTAPDFQHRHISNYSDGLFGGTTTTRRTQIIEILNPKSRCRVRI